MVSWVHLISAVCLLVGVCFSTEIASEEHQDELKLPETVQLQTETQSDELGLKGYDEKLHDHDHKHATSYQSFYLESKNPVPIVIKKEYHYKHKPVHHEFSYGSHENSVPQQEGFQYDYYGLQRH